MMPASVNKLDAISTAAASKRLGRSSCGTDPLIFADIYQDNINMTTWQRDLSQPLKASVRRFLLSRPDFQSNLTVTPHNVSSCLNEAFGSDEYLELVDNITELVEVFCYLLETSHAGLRLTALDRAMCPKFHVDRVPCRLVTTYEGIATEWLSHDVVDRTKLGLGSQGLKDSESGLYQHHEDIQQLDCGDVAILKGETWMNNENAGLVHRSPSPSTGERRLLLTLDFVV